MTGWPRDEFVTWLDRYMRFVGIKSDYKLAAHLGIGHTLISGWRNGRQRPEFRTLERIAESTGEDLRRLMVLAGLGDAISLGLLESDTRPMIRPIPAQVESFLDVYYDDERMTDEDRTLALRQVDILRRIILADLAERESDGPPN